MFYILCIETATEICSVAVITPTKILALIENHEGNVHASQLTILIDKAVKKAGVTLQQLDAIAVSKGPGSYTGLRVGVSTAKGLCYALDKPLIGIPTLQTLRAMVAGEGRQSAVGSRQFIAHDIKQTNLIEDSADRGLRTVDFPKESLFIPMLDARRMEVYCAGYDIDGEEILKTEAKIIDESSFAEELNSGPVYFMGNGAAKCKTVISHPNVFFIDDVHCSAKGMFKLAAAAFEQKQFEDVAYFEPFYLKDFVATTPKKRV
jgi:tRNA threonylcarbamoyladenosine biosynthesis protein TsaB